MRQAKPSDPLIDGLAQLSAGSPSRTRVPDLVVVSLVIAILVAAITVLVLTTLG